MSKYLLWRNRLVHISGDTSFEDEASISFRLQSPPPEVVQGQLGRLGHAEEVDLDDSQICLHGRERGV